MHVDPERVSLQAHSCMVLLFTTYLFFFLGAQLPLKRNVFSFTSVSHEPTAHGE